MPALVANSGDAVGSGDLNFLGSVGADQPGDVVFDAALQDAQLKESDGTTAVKWNKQLIFLDISNNGHTLTAIADSDGDGDFTTGVQTTVFTVTLDPVGDSYTIDFDQALDDGSGLKFDNFKDAPAGLNDFIGLDDPRVPSQDEDILFTGGDPIPDSFDGGSDGHDEVNTSDFGIGVNSQNIVVGETLRMDFVNGVNLSDGTGGSSSGDSNDITRLFFTDHYVANNVAFTLIQTGGNADNEIDVLITVYDEDDAPPDQDPNTVFDPNDLLGDPKDTITSVTVVNTFGDDDPLNDVILIDDALRTGGDITLNGVSIVWNVDGSVEVQDLLVDYQVFVSTDDGFNRLEVKNVSNEGQANDTFDLGGIEVTTETTGNPIPMEFDLTVTDEDGDTSDGTLAVTTVPDGGATITGSGADEALIGGSGADRLEGGGGADILTGNAGADVFVYSTGDGGTLATADVISDFEDGIDLIDLQGTTANVIGDVTIDANGGNASISVGGEVLAVLTGIADTDLDSNDFIF
jgi:hypothetical protein